ncbi:thioredoxin H1 [Dioscorea cayenensis subsp. rotundata]|uniref:Phloem sap 13 kDa protein 1 n=1 Tax=Dioscorea cayennensis subsp. rotundata TaxID=55577 RepID=A0AB40CNE2_DIOCR|nr:thioredoxin H1 [Dioscorea cayenensis subsp. rotundata]
MAEEGAVIACHTEADWRQQLQLANESNKLAVIDFTASWCGPCRVIAPFFVELAKRFTDVIFLKVDIDELKVVAQEWAIEAMPTFIFLKKGTILDKMVGARKDDLPKKIQEYMAK